MTPEASRRGFLGALALATPAFGLGLQRPSSGTPATIASSTDAVFDQIRLQFVVALRRARSTGSVSAEDAAACATSLRIAAVHARDRGLDQAAAAALRRTIAREG